MKESTAVTKAGCGRGEESRPLFFAANGRRVRLYRCGTVVVGSGAAGYNAADRLWQYGCRDTLLVTENRLGGTSRNAGSDKQTYYKLTLSGGEGDSVREMAQTIFAGQCTDGDTALCEAALSVQTFLKLVELGVPFPCGRHGEYVGYKTDHDPRCRATSAGPYTSRQMTECLERSVFDKGVPVLDHAQVIRILSDGTQVYGLLCLDTAAPSGDCFLVIHCRNIVWATGGPAGIYAESVYPSSQYGATGLALEAGARGQNLTEWQYGLASVRPRWNVSGTYMQALPRVYSARPDGSEEREFLLDFFPTAAEMLNKLFLKGYQWPFDVRKVADGSSLIDILVYLESCKGRKVYLDYRRNPAWGNFRFSDLDPEALDYLTRAGVCFGTPIERLTHMNAPAVAFFADQGIDLAAQPLEIALCAQHNNGGLAVNCWWQTHVHGLFAVGEAAGTHGVYRPGGTALNAGQAGGTRAAQYIAARRLGLPPEHDPAFAAAAEAALDALAPLAEKPLASEGNARKLLIRAARRMSSCAAVIRDRDAMAGCLHHTEKELAALPYTVTAASTQELPWVYRLRDTLLCQRAYLSAMLDYADRGGGSRGSAIYTDRRGQKPYQQLPDCLTYVLDDGSRDSLVQEVACTPGGCTVRWRAVRPIPQDDDFFENVWRLYRETGCIDE